MRFCFRFNQFSVFKLFLFVVKLDCTLHFSRQALWRYTVTSQKHGWLVHMCACGNGAVFTPWKTTDDKVPGAIFRGGTKDNKKILKFAYCSVFNRKCVGQWDVQDIGFCSLGYIPLLDKILSQPEFCWRAESMFPNYTLLDHLPHFYITHEMKRQGHARMGDVDMLWWCSNSNSSSKFELTIKNNFSNVILSGYMQSLY